MTDAQDQDSGETFRSFGTGVELPGRNKLLDTFVEVLSRIDRGGPYSKAIDTRVRRYWILDI